MSSNLEHEFISPRSAGQSHPGRRSRLETCGDILRIIAAGEQKPTHIMYKANLSWTIMQGYISNLEMQGYIVSVMDKDRRFYRLSQKGFDLLNKMESVKEELGVLLAN